MLIWHESQKLAVVCAVCVVTVTVLVLGGQIAWIGAGLFGVFLGWRLSWRIAIPLIVFGAGLGFLRVLVIPGVPDVLPDEKVGIVTDQPQYYNDHVRIFVGIDEGVKWVVKIKDRFAQVGMGDRVAFSCANEWEDAPMLAAWNAYGGCSVWEVEVLERAGSPLTWLTRARTQMKKRIRTSFPEPAASLVIGMTIGEEGGLPEKLRDQFRDTGLTHLVALSGYNVTLLFGWIASFASLLVLGPRGKVGLMIVCGAVFLTFIGWQPSLMRATIMGSLAVIGAMLGRQHLSTHLLLVAATGMIVYQPTMLASVGFLLSAGSTIGLIKWGEAFTQKWEWVGFPHVVAEPLGLTTAAMLAVTPILLGIFGQANPWTLLANLLAGPLVPFVMTGGLVFLLPAPYASVFVPVAYIAGTAIARIATSISLLPNPFETLGEWPIQAHWYGLVLIFLLTWLVLKPCHCSYPSLRSQRG